MHEKKRRYQRVSAWSWATAAILAIAVAAGPAAAQQTREPSHQGRTVSQWITLAGSEDYDEVAKASDALRAMGSAAVPALIATLARPVNRNARLVSLRVLGTAGGPGVAAALGRVVKADSDSMVQFAAAQEIATLADKGDRAAAAEAAALIPSLMKTMTENPEAARDASSVLQALGQLAKPALTGAALTHASAHVRETAVDALSASPFAGSDVTAILVKALQDPESSVRAAAVHVIGLRAAGQPADAAPAVDALIRALQDKDDTVQSGAAEELGRIGPPARRAVPALKALLRDPSESVKDTAAEALKLLEPSAPRP